MYTDDDFIQLSALQHFTFCPRQCALIHIEQVWLENMFTAEGKVMHDKAHKEQFETRDGVRIERGMPLRSRELGLSGKADVIEFHKAANVLAPFPVEYKRGKPKKDLSDKIQLCAQALCLEEMLNVPVPAGALFYGKTRRRFEVEFDDALRRETINAVTRLRVFIKEAVTPKPVYASKCDSCSLVDVCIPQITSGKQPVKEYLLKETEEE